MDGDMYDCVVPRKILVHVRNYEDYFPLVIAPFQKSVSIYELF